MQANPSDLDRANPFTFFKEIHNTFSPHYFFPLQMADVRLYRRPASALGGHSLRGNVSSSAEHAVGHAALAPAVAVASGGWSGAYPPPAVTELPIAPQGPAVRGTAPAATFRVSGVVPQRHYRCGSRESSKLIAQGGTASADVAAAASVIAAVDEVPQLFDATDWPLSANVVASRLDVRRILDTNLLRNDIISQQRRNPNGSGGEGAPTGTSPPRRGCAAAASSFKSVKSATSSFATVHPALLDVPCSSQDQPDAAVTTSFKSSSFGNSSRFGNSSPVATRTRQPTDDDKVDPDDRCHAQGVSTPYRITNAATATAVARVFISDPVVMVDRATSYMWRECPDPDIIPREAAVYNHVLHTVRRMTAADAFSAPADHTEANDTQGPAADVVVSPAHAVPAALSGVGTTTSGLLRVLGCETRFLPLPSSSSHTSALAVATLPPEASGNNSSVKAFRTVHYVVTEPYRGTLMHLLHLSRQAAEKGHGPPPLRAPTVVVSLRDVLQQLFTLHRCGVCHNALHPEGIILSVCDSIDLGGNDASPLATAQHVRSRRDTTTSLTSEVNSLVSGGGGVSSSDSSRVGGAPASAHNSARGSVNDSRAASSAGSLNSQHARTEHRHQRAADGSMASTQPKFDFCALVHPEALLQPQASRAVNDASVGKLATLAFATIYDRRKLRPIGPFTLSAQRLDPIACGLHVLPNRPRVVDEFCVPPEWLGRGQYGINGRGGGDRRASFDTGIHGDEDLLGTSFAGSPTLQGRHRRRSSVGLRGLQASPGGIGATSPSGTGGAGGGSLPPPPGVVPRTVVIPSPVSDAFLFGKVVKFCFRGIVSAASILDDYVAEVKRQRASEMAKLNSRAPPTAAEVQEKLEEAMRRWRQVRDKAEATLAETKSYMSALDLIGATELVHVVRQSTIANPDRRLSTRETLCHPFFWTVATSSEFICCLAEFLSPPRAAGSVTSLATATSYNKSRTIAAVGTAVNQGTASPASGSSGVVTPAEKGLNTLQLSGSSATAANTTSSANMAKCPAATYNVTKDLLQWSSMPFVPPDGALLRAALSTTSTSTTVAASNAVEGSASSVTAVGGSLGPSMPVDWLQLVRDWYEALCRENVAGIRYDYEGTVRDLMSFYSNVYGHLKQHASPVQISMGDASRFCHEFVHQRFSGVQLTWLQRLAKSPSDAEKFVQFLQGKGRLVVPSMDALTSVIQRMVAEHRWHNMDARADGRSSPNAGRRLLGRSGF